MMNSKESKTTSLLRLIEEKALKKKMEEEKRKQEETPVPYLPKDCVSNIILRLPLDALQRSRARIWREIDGPSSGLIRWFGYNPVFSIGALHWIPEVDRSDYIVSMEIDNEKFHQIPLPRSSRTHDRILDVGGFLGFVIHEEFDQIDVWILRALFGEVWTKHHSITIGCILDMVPLFTLRIKGDMIFMREEDGSLYVYNFELQEMNKIEMVTKCFPFNYSFLPHVNGLTLLHGEGETQ